MCAYLSRARDDFRPVGLADDADAELLGLLELRPGSRPRNDEVGLGADRTGRSCAESLGLRFCLVAAHGFQGAREDDRLPGPFRLAGVTDERLGRDL